MGPFAAVAVTLRSPGVVSPHFPGAGWWRFALAYGGLVVTLEVATVSGHASKNAGPDHAFSRTKASNARWGIITCPFGHVAHPRGGGGLSMSWSLWSIPGIQISGQGFSCPLAIGFGFDSFVACNSKTKRKLVIDTNRQICQGVYDFVSWVARLHPGPGR